MRIRPPPPPGEGREAGRRGARGSEVDSEPAVRRCRAYLSPGARLPRDLPHHVVCFRCSLCAQRKPGAGRGDHHPDGGLRRRDVGLLRAGPSHLGASAAAGARAVHPVPQRLRRVLRQRRLHRRRAVLLDGGGDDLGLPGPHPVGPRRGDVGLCGRGSRRVGPGVPAPDALRALCIGGGPLPRHRVLLPGGDAGQRGRHPAGRFCLRPKHRPARACARARGRPARRAAAQARRALPAGEHRAGGREHPHFCGGRGGGHGSLRRHGGLLPARPRGALRAGGARPGPHLPSAGRDRPPQRHPEDQDHRRRLHGGGRARRGWRGLGPQRDGGGRRRPRLHGGRGRARVPGQPGALSRRPGDGPGDRRGHRQRAAALRHLGGHRQPRGAHGGLRGARAHPRVPGDGGPPRRHASARRGAGAAPRRAPGDADVLGGGPRGGAGRRVRGGAGGGATAPGRPDGAAQRRCPPGTERRRPRAGRTPAAGRHGRRGAPPGEAQSGTWATRTSRPRPSTKGAPSRPPKTEKAEKPASSRRWRSSATA